MNRQELFKCYSADILDCDPNKLVDLNTVEIASCLPVPQRMEHYLEQIRNPYLFRLDQLTVKISFNGKRDLSSVLASLMAQN